MKYLNVRAELGGPAPPSRHTKRRGRAAAIAMAVLALGLAARPASGDDGPSETSPAGAQKVVAFAAGGVGLAGLAGGVVFGLLASGSWKSAKSECPSTPNCPDHAGAVADHDSAEQWATTSTVAFAAGGALLAAAVVLVLTAPPERAPTGDAVALRIVPGVGAGGAGLVVAGTF